MSIMQRVIQHAESLEPLPITAAKLAQVVADEKSDIKDMADVIQYDQALAADVLKMANSAYSASTRTIGDVKEAVVRLGSSHVLQMIISKQVRSMMKQPLEQYGYGENELWYHSVASAVAAECLNKYINIKIPGIAFTAALLHDIGKLVMVQVFPEENMKRIWGIMSEKQVSCICAEKELFGFTHADIGAHMADFWKLPEDIVRAIKNHNIINKDFNPVTDSVRLSNIVARAIGKGVGYEGMSMDVDSDITGRLGLEREKYELLCAETLLKFEDVISEYESN